MTRIAIGGFQHETNTFSDKPADFDVFVEADGWPGMVRGQAMFPALEGYNIGVTGLIEGAQSQGWEIVPLSWSYGGAGGKVTEDAFERISAMLLQELRDCGEIDGLLLDLHGAMVCEHFDDGEGELLRRIRKQTGPELPIVACLDLHANVTPEMVDLADRLVIYRTYPHVDMAETGNRAAFELGKILDGDPRKPRAFRQFPFLIPMTVGCTMLNPAKWLYERANEYQETAGISHVSVACGFHASDIYHCGPSLVVYGGDQDLADWVADQFMSEILERENEFSHNLWNVEEAVGYAMANAAKHNLPIVLADIQDNYGGGSFSDTTWILNELLRQGAKNAALGVLCDAEAALAAHEAGEGSTIEIALGAKSGLEGHKAVKAEFQVEAISDGDIKSTGVYFAGGTMRLEPMALLNCNGTRVVVSSRAEQAADQAMFAHLGLDPASVDILVLKSTVHYRADFQPIAAEVLEVVAPAPLIADTRLLDYQNLRPGLRVMPGNQTQV